MKNHTDVVKARTEEVTAVADKVYLSVAPRDANGKLPPPPYVVIHPSDGIDTQAAFTGPLSTQHPRFVFHMVGKSYDQVAALTKLVKDKFIVNGRGVKLTVAGEVCKPCFWSSPLPTQVNDQIKPPLIYNVAELGFQTDPA